MDEYRARAIKAHKTKDDVINKVEEFRKQNNIEVKCISDQTFLYIRYIISKLETNHPKTKLDPRFKSLVYKIYKETRGNNHEIGINVPSSLAAAIIAIASTEYKTDFDIRIITQVDIADTLQSTTTMTVSKAKRKLELYFADKDINFDLEIRHKR